MQTQESGEGDQEEEEEVEAPPAKRTRSSAAKEAPKSVKRPATPKDFKQPIAVEIFKGVGESQAAVSNLSDLKEVVELTDFLQKMVSVCCLLS